MSHWKKHAAQWTRINSPLRPCAEDVALFAQAAGTGKGLLLGVTPELRKISPDMTAIDSDLGMIQNTQCDIAVAHADWLDMPFEDHTFDFVIGDGHLTNLLWPRDYKLLRAELARVLKPEGRIVFRAFLAPDVQETVEEVLANPGDNFHAFKWRFAQALLLGGDPNIPVAGIHMAFERFVPDRSVLPFPIEDINTIDVYKNATALYSFPTRAQLKEIFGEEVSFTTGSYTLAERCPVIRFKNADASRLADAA